MTTPLEEIPLIRIFLAELRIWPKAASINILSIDMKLADGKRLPRNRIDPRAESGCIVRSLADVDQIGLFVRLASRLTPTPSGRVPGFSNLLKHCNRARHLLRL